MATCRRRRNFIHCLQINNELVIDQPLIRNAFEDHFSSTCGSSQQADFLVDWVSLYLSTLDLSHLESPLSLDEVRVAVFGLGADKAPGPDGYPIFFYQKCWDVIKADLYKLMNDVFFGKCSLDRFNYSDIALIPKCDGANKVNEFRPISLMNCNFKIFTKILANRLNPILPDLVDPSQAAFLKGRSTLDSFLIAHEMVNYCTRRKADLVMLKIDFMKAFDCLNWEFIIDMLKARGFGSKWCSWIQLILSTAKSSILINGSRGKIIQSKRGLKQGDPLSPMLFILAVDVLSNMLKKGRDDGVFYIPELKGNLKNITSLQFADDTLIFCDANEQDMIHLKILLAIFEDVSGLSINYSKTSLVYFGKSNLKSSILASIIQCKTDSLPLKYLGLQLKRGKLNKREWQPVIEKFERKLASWKGKSLSFGGRLTLINSVLSSLPLHFASFFRLPTWLIKKIDTIRSRFLWKGDVSQSKALHHVNWGRVCKSKKQGGLGVLNLADFNRALLLKWLWKFYSPVSCLSIDTLHSLYSSSSPHVPPKSASFFWKGISSLADIFFHNLSWKIGDGQSILFWKSRWLEGVSIANLYPALYTLAWNENAQVSSQGFWLNNEWVWHPATKRITCASASSQLKSLLPILRRYKPSLDRDIPIWILTAAGDFSTKSAYSFLNDGGLISPYAKFTWNSFAPLKIQVFMWLLSWNKLFTKEILLHRGVNVDPICGTCAAQAIESACHLFLECPMARDIWSHFTSKFGICTMPNSIEDLINSWWKTIDANISIAWKLMIAAICWTIWLRRNSICFKNGKISASIDIQSANYLFSSWVSVSREGKRRDKLIRAIHFGGFPFFQ